MKASQEKIKALNQLKGIEIWLEGIETSSQGWTDINKEGVTGFLLSDVLDSINSKVQVLTNKFN